MQIQRLRRRTAIGLGLLGLQFLLGMANTFWLATPETGKGWGASDPEALLYAHILIGLGLVIGAVVIHITAQRAHLRVWIITSGVALLGVVGAFVAGILFMSDVSNDVLSYLMAIGFALAVGAYIVALVRPAAAEA